MELSYFEFEATKQAVELILKRKRRCEGLLSSGNTSAIVNIMTMHDENKKITDYHRQQIVRAIAIPNAKMFFLSNSSYEPNCVEKLATFIEDNSFVLRGL